MPQFILPNTSREQRSGTPLMLTVSLLLILSIAIGYFAWWAPLQHARAQEAGIAAQKNHR